MNSMPRVLHVAEVIKGGTATYLSEIDSEDINAPHFRYLVPESEVQYLPRHRQGNALTFKPRSRRALNVFAMAPTLFKCAVSGDFDVIHAHGTFAGLCVRILRLCGLVKTPIVYCAHGWAFDRDSSSIVKAAYSSVERFLQRSADSIICISRHDYKSAVVRGLSEENLVVVLNGIKDRTPRGDTASRAQPTILFAGRFDRQKGIDVFLEALGHTQTKFRAIAVGDVSSGDLNVDRNHPNVEFPGWLEYSGVQRLIDESDVFVMPSRWEGFGLSALEAMRAGKAVIASSVGGLPELVVDGETGFLVQPGDPIALAKAIDKAVTADTSALGQRGRERFLKLFTAQRLREELVEVYRNVMNSNSKRSVKPEQTKV